MRLSSIKTDRTTIRFQFTHPGRGATSIPYPSISSKRGFNSRTPGGVRRAGANQAVNTYLQFQFTHPGRGATAFAHLCYPDVQFQFTHPGRGATTSSTTRTSHHISFNSRTPGGVRLQIDSTKRPSRSFNSRTPGGVRLMRLLSLKSPHKFQFTHPGRGATSLTTSEAEEYLFQFTHPGRGATRAYSLIALMLCGFNSRTPGGVRLVPDSDYSGVGMFQFTHPGRGATPVFTLGNSLAITFQFTHPGRGATAEKSRRRRCCTCFNSRTPGGVRPP